MLLMRKVLMRACGRGGNPNGKQKVQSSERASYGEKPLGKAPWKGIQEWHNYSLLCRSPPSTSDVHSKRCSLLLGRVDFIFAWTHRLGVDLLSFCFLSLCFNFSHKANDHLWYKTSLQALVNAADTFLFRSNYQRKCFQILVSCAI